MKRSRKACQKSQLQRLRSLRLVLVGVGILLTAALIVVFLLWFSSPGMASSPDREPSNRQGSQSRETQPFPTDTSEAAVSPEPQETQAAQETESPAAEPVNPPETVSDSDITDFLDKDREKEGIDEDSGPEATVDIPTLSGSPSAHSFGSATVFLMANTRTQSGGMILPQPKAPEGSPEAAVPAQGDASGMETLPKRPGQAASGLQRGVFMTLCVLLGVDAAGILILSVMIAREAKSQKEASKAPEAAPCPAADALPCQAPIYPLPSVGKVHNIGARPYQEDSLGVAMLEDGVFAVVADGMGGLSGGDKVSQEIVKTMLSYSDRLTPSQMDGILGQMVDAVNDTVNRMLGPNGLYKSGSTLLAVLVRQGRFHWITVGDSHIYLYRDGTLIQLNQEHNRGQELLRKAVRGEISFEEARSDPKKNGLTSFIGMGSLRYIDKSIQSIPLKAGDRIALMTDGVFNTLPDMAIASVLAQYSEAQEAAGELERRVISRGNPRQDNFTAVILGF